MPEIKPDMSEWSRCISVHWSLPVQCVLPCTHRENWHEAWHPNGNRIRYRRSMGIFRTEERSGDDWIDLEIPPPGEVCGEPHISKPGVFCQDARGHGWTHHATVDGCRHTWHPALRELTTGQVAQDLTRIREIAAEAIADRDKARAELPKCNGMCLRASDVLDDLSHVVGNPVARAHRSCPKHGDLEDVAKELDAALIEAETDRDEARALIKRLTDWSTSDVVTAKSSFGDGYREAMRDIRDLIQGDKS